MSNTTTISNSPKVLIKTFSFDHNVLPTCCPNMFAICMHADHTENLGYGLTELICLNQKSPCTFLCL